MNDMERTITAVKAGGGGLLDALLAAQAPGGFLTEPAIAATAGIYGMQPAQVYETASFYSMLRFSPAGKTVIQVCRNAPCHVAGAARTIEALEAALNVKMGQTTPDGRYSLEFTECLGQCQSSPAVVVNGKLYSDVTCERVPALLNALN